ncbi:hypothetical protein CMV_016210 [Castanea mollissima]|uniref:Uncharacterized protein n=1 Tax=Castanea mollissima TaxID=60419 RepID=A0A8J4R7M1_9ROSI|nr:hypothetical protein CMV_016210 [Castanea mollissima]
MMDKPRLTTSTLDNHDIHSTTLMPQLGYKLTLLSSALDSNRSLIIRIGMEDVLMRYVFGKKKTTEFAHSLVICSSSNRMNCTRSCCHL